MLNWIKLTDSIYRAFLPDEMPFTIQLHGEKWHLITPDMFEKPNPFNSLEEAQAHAQSLADTYVPRSNKTILRSERQSVTNKKTS